MLVLADSLQTASSHLFPVWSAFMLPGLLLIFRNGSKTVLFHLTRKREAWTVVGWTGRKNPPNPFTVVVVSFQGFTFSPEMARVVGFGTDITQV